MGLFKRKDTGPNQLTLEANGLLPSASAQNSQVETETGLNTEVKNNAEQINLNTDKVEIVAPTTPSIEKPHIKKIKKIAAISGLAVFFIIAATGVLTFMGIDLVVMQPFLTGKVTSGNNAIPAASIKIAGKTIITDSLGFYRVDAILPGIYDVEISAPNFATLNERISIERSYLNYENVKNFELNIVGQTTAQGKIIVADTSYRFTNDRIIIGDKSYTINPDGTFTIADAPVGRFDWEYRSVNYTDLKQNFLFRERELNELGEFRVNPAGDLLASTISYLNEDVVTDLQVTVEGVDAEKVSISNEGILRIKDLEIARQYRIDVSHERYVSRRYTATVRQGESEILNFRVVEKGKIPFIRRVNNQNVLVTSDYDGENVVQLTQGTANPENLYLDGTQVYFAGTIDNVSSNVGSSRVPLAYVVSQTGGSAVRVTTNTNNLGETNINFAARKFLNFRRGSTNTERVLEIADIDGTNRLPVFSGNRITLTNRLLSDNGRAVSFVLQATDDTGGLYWSNIETPAQLIAQKPNIVALDISATGNRVLYLSNNPTTGVSDLYMFIVNEGKDVLLRSGWRGQQVQFLANSENEIVFFELRDGASNIFKVNLNDNQESRLTNFNSGESVEQISQQPNLLVYETNRGLYVLNIQKPKPAKLVTTNYTRVSTN